MEPPMRAIAFAFSLGPVLFGIGFLAPLIAALLGAAGVTAPLGQSPLHIGLVTGVLLGLVARHRGTWLW
jgi:hypothetical protein